MAQVRASHGTIFNAGIEGEDYKDDVIPRQLLFVAALCLHELDNKEDRFNVYRYYTNEKPKGIGEYLRLCTSNQKKQVDNNAQEQLTKLMPERTKAHLYLCAYSADVPTHYARLEKRGNFWGIASERLVVLTPGKKLPSDGVIVHWPSKRDEAMKPEMARSINRSAEFKRVLTGGVEIGLIAKLAEEDYEVRRQLSHAVLVSEAFTTSNKSNRLLVREGPSSAAFHYSPGDAPPSTIAWVEPLTFTLDRITAQARPASDMRPVVFRSDHLIQHETIPNPIPRCILPKLAKWQRFYKYPWPEEMAKVYNDDILDIATNFLVGGLLPYIGIHTGDGTVRFYGLSIISEDRTRIVEYPWTVPSKKSSIFPVISTVPVMSGTVTWTANKRLSQIMAAMIYADKGTPGADRRLGYLTDIMKRQMQIRPKTIIGHFVERAIMLTTQQIAVMGERLEVIIKYS